MESLVLIDPSLFPTLKEKLQNNIPDSQWVKVVAQGLLHYMSAGVFAGKIYTDKWPDFKVVLLHADFPELPLANGYIWCFANCQANKVFEMIDKLSRIHEGSCWIAGESWFMHEFNDWLVPKCEITRHDAPEVQFDLIDYHLPDTATVLQEKMSLKCPEGFQLKRLEEHHAAFIAANWKYDTPGGKLHFLTKLVETFYCFGVFTDSTPDPVAWVLRYSPGYLGHLFVSANYRRKGLGKLLTWHMCAQIFKDGGVPLVDVEKNNLTANVLFKDFGFVELGNTVTLSVTRKHE